MTNVNHNALSKFWFSIFNPSTGYSSKTQYYNLLNLKTRNLFFFKNRTTMLLYTKNKNLMTRTYHQISAWKKRHVKKNLVLKALQVKLYQSQSTLNLQIFIHNPDAFYAIQYDYYTRITRSRLLQAKNSHIIAVAETLRFLTPTTFLNLIAKKKNGTWRYLTKWYQIINSRVW